MRANSRLGCHPLGRLLLGICLLAGCDTSATLGQRSEVDSAGVSIIRLPEAERRLSWRFDAVFEVGGASDPTILVGRLLPGQVAGTEAGAVLLLDTQGSRVVMLDSLGRLHREFGSAGAGPGEVRLPNGLAATADLGHWSSTWERARCSSGIPAERWSPSAGFRCSPLGGTSG